eukprot:13934673-Alexandrium_andersonii.AAC.1
MLATDKPGWIKFVDDCLSVPKFVDPEGWLVGMFMRKRFHERFNGAFPWEGNYRQAYRVFISDCYAELGFPDAA